MFARKQIRYFVWLCFSLVVSSTSYAVEPLLEGVDFFEKKIRPILVDHCYSCHSTASEKIKGGLLLDSSEAMIKGGDTGPALIPGRAAESLLIKAVRYSDPELQMPPKNKKLSQRQIADLEQWINQGAPWPIATGVTTGSTNRVGFEITEKDRAYWAFQPVRRPVLPHLKGLHQGANPLDVLIASELEGKGIAPNGAASKHELMRRVYFDLIGLPPTPEALAAFEKDNSPKSFERVVDGLLARPEYGERWGRHWLDVVRYAQSNGYERDSEKPLAWRYRDYVVNAFNTDKPYDQFVREQIAGDELLEVTPDSIIATGFQRLGVWDDEPDDKRMAEFDELDDILSTTGTAMLGLTLGCARCHDHKFDPISHSDYYKLLAFFRNVRPYENARYTIDSANYAPIASQKEVETWRQQQQATIDAIEAQIKGSTEETKRKKLADNLKAIQSKTPPFPWALAVRERGGTVPATHVLVRGNASSPSVEVLPAFPTVLGGVQPNVVPPGSGTASSGRRLALADWLSSRDNPLTARVMVNRIWQHHFGSGLVKTTTDFGRAGTPPTHPQLLDWLAAEFMEKDWSIKELHRTILLSETYQRSSKTDNPKAQKLDPGNNFLWRHNLRRLEAEAIRDTFLSISGTLNPAMGGRGFFPHLAGEVLAGASRPGLDWEQSTLSERSRRSIYAYVRRSMLVPELDIFDYSNTTSPLGERPVTTVAPQALLLLNDPFIHQQANVFTERVIRESTSPQLEDRIRHAYRLALGRTPKPHELEVARSFVDRQSLASSRIQSRVTFRPDVPVSLSVGYMEQLPPTKFLIGPKQNWNYYRGRWSASYEGISTVERLRGPFALWQNVDAEDVIVEADLLLDRAADSASLLVRSSGEGTKQRAYEVCLEPRQRQISILRQAEKLEILASIEVRIPLAETIKLRVECVGPRIRIWMDGSEKPLLEAVDSKPLTGSGKVGVRAWGAPVHFDSLTVKTGQRQFVLEPDRIEASTPSFAERSGLESFCLLLLNLNEVIYVD